MSSFGIIEAVELDGKNLRRSEITKRIQDLYWKIVSRECVKTD